MNYAFPAFALGLSLFQIVSATAQERVASGNMNVEATWQALKSLTEQANGNAKMALNLANSQYTCSLKGMFYSPGAAGVDADKCKASTMPNPAQLAIKTYSQKLCTYGGYHSVVSSCPSDERLLGCGGGPGDQKESGEYWVLMPDFANNRCIGHVGNPWCYPEMEFGRTVVTAICYKP